MIRAFLHSRNYSNIRRRNNFNLHCHSFKETDSCLCSTSLVKIAACLHKVGHLKTFKLSQLSFVIFYFQTFKMVFSYQKIIDL